MISTTTVYWIALKWEVDVRGAGFENVYRLQGNYAAWVDAGYPVER